MINDVVVVCQNASTMKSQSVLNAVTCVTQKRQDLVHLQEAILFLTYKQPYHVAQCKVCSDHGGDDSHDDDDHMVQHGHDGGDHMASSHDGHDDGGRSGRDGRDARNDDVGGIVHHHNHDALFLLLLQECYVIWSH